MQTGIDYCSDVVFKFVFGRNIDLSIQLRDFLLNQLLGVNVNGILVSNPELIPRFIRDRNVILDIHMQSHDMDINIEMQNSLLSRYVYRRFQYYSAKMLSGQLGSGEDFNSLKDVYQIILIEDKERNSDELIEVFHAKEQSNRKDMPYYMQTTIYVYLPNIEKIAKRKAELSEWEAVVYLLHKGTLEGIRYEEKEGMVKKMERLYSEFMGDGELVNATMVRNQRRENYKVWHDMDVEDAKKEGIEKGIKRGIEEGIEKGIEKGIKKGIEEGIEKGIEKGMNVGKQEQLIELLSFKYPNENHEWVRECTQQQLDIIIQHIFKDINYDQLKKMIH